MHPPKHVHTAQELADIAAAKETDRIWPRRPDGSQMEAGEWNDRPHKKGEIKMQKTLSLVMVFAILAWTVSLNMARAECYSPSYPTSYNIGQYNRCVEDEMEQQRSEQWRQAQQLQDIENQLRRQRYAR